MENNRKGNGIFLGIVSVATLVVAIIGATFAYFSATTESNEDAVNLQAYEFSLAMSVSPIYPGSANKIIPFAADNQLVDTNGDDVEGQTLLTYALNSNRKGFERCVDDNGLQECALYEVKITNSNTNPITLGGQIRTVNNEPGKGGETFSNLTYQTVYIDEVELDEYGAIKYNDDTAFNVFTKDSKFGDKENRNRLTAIGKKTIDGEIDGLTDIDSIYVPASTEDIGFGNGVGVGYVLIYLNDIYTDDDNNENDDQSVEMGAKYTGQLIYSSKAGDAGSTLTGTFRVAGTDPAP